jgi:CheY-like chemotaxis protein
VKHRILLADDSPHAQRMGERILREEGFEVVSVTDGETALVRLQDFRPDLVIADVSLPRKTGYDVCRNVKGHQNYKFTKVVLTAGLLEPFSHEEARNAGSDGILRKPFEASIMLETVQTLIEAAEFARKLFPREPEPDSVEDIEDLLPQPEPVVVQERAPEPEPEPVAVAPPAQVPTIIEIDPSLVRAAVTLALESALPTLIDEATAHILQSLNKPLAQ